MSNKIKTKIASGVFWSIVMRWSIKFIGLINTIILARLLTPDDFGVVAMAFLFIGLIQELSTVNTALLLIRTKDEDRSQADTAWTVGMLQSVFVAILLLILAPFAADYFNDERVIAVISLLALSKIFQGARNIGVVLAIKDLDFSFDFKFMVLSRLIVFFCVISIAFTRKDYWAIVYGSLIAEIIIVAVSFWMHAYRPRFSVKHFKNYVVFALAMIPMALAKLLNNKFDVIVVGGMSGTSLMGIYNLASELTSMFTIELVLPASRGLFPNFSKLKDNRDEFINVYLQILVASIAICLPIGVGLYLVADEFVFLLLGSQWMESVVYIQWLVIYGTLVSIIILMSEHPLIALGYEAKVNYLMWFRLSVLIVCVLLGFNLKGIEGVSMGMAVSSLLTFPLVLGYISFLLKIPMGNILLNGVRPVLSVIIMSLGILFLQEFTSDLHESIGLITSVLMGIFLYVSSLLLLWVVFGKPEGFEYFVIKKIKN